VQAVTADVDLIRSNIERHIEELDKEFALLAQALGLPGNPFVAVSGQLRAMLQMLLGAKLTTTNTDPYGVKELEGE
jgi:hypothetical protein